MLAELFVPHTLLLRKLDNVITLSGTAFLEMHYGPPNYGEDPATDKKMNQVFLKLDVPLRVVRKNRGDNFAGTTTITVKDIQLAAMHYPPAGQHVVVTGSLYGAETGYHNRPVLIDVSSLRSGGRIGCNGKEAPLKR